MSSAFRVPVPDDYVGALGRAACSFSYLEWGTVWLAETIDPGFISRVGGMTAGRIAREFRSMSASCKADDAQFLQSLAAAFSKLVKDRNALLHSLPYTSAGGEQRLLHIGATGRRHWSKDQILKAADDFEAVAIEANELLHSGRYEAYKSATGRVVSV